MTSPAAMHWPETAEEITARKEARRAAVKREREWRDEHNIEDDVKR